MIQVLNVMPDLKLAQGCGWSLQPCEMWHCRCTGRSWCFGRLECLLIGSSIVSKCTLQVPDSEDESSTMLGKVLTWWQSAIYQNTGIFNKMWYSGVLLLLSELFVMNVLEIAYNFFLINYRALIWRFVSCGMLTHWGRGNLNCLNARFLRF